MATDGYAVPFGDSHRTQGWGSKPDVLRAMVSKGELFYPVNDGKSVMGRSAEMEAWLLEHRACEVRSWFASAYFQHSYNTNPANLWQFGTHKAKNWSKIIAGCTGTTGNGTTRYGSGNASSADPLSRLSGTRQLGGGSEVVYSVAGYAAMQSPLLPTDSSTYADADTGHLCFSSSRLANNPRKRGADCIHNVANLTADSKSLSLAANTPYSFLAVEAKGNAMPHAEIDYGTLVWTAWGVRLLSEHGYGTNTHTHTHTYIYIYTSMYISACLLLYVPACLQVYGSAGAGATAYLDPS